MTAGLIALVNPIPMETFFREYWTKQFLHIPGPPDKLAHLYSWDVLNRALEEHRFGSKRLALVRGGQGLDPPRYLSMGTGQVNASRLVQEFDGGATIIFNQCEETYPPLRELCVELERLFHVGILVNLYAVRGTDNGFDVHWDEQDTFILQVAGRKHWKVWGPTRADPFREDVVDTSPATKPSGPPIWDGILEQGSVLNMPRGWWHVAYPIGEPSLHLTLTIKNLTGIDLLQWFAEQTKATATARMSVPIMQGEDAKRQWLEDLRKSLSAGWSDDLMDRYLADCDRRVRVRPSLALPAGRPKASSADVGPSPFERRRPVRAGVPRVGPAAGDDHTVSLLKRLRTGWNGFVAARRH